MTHNTLKYCLEQVYATAIAALIPATFIGVLKFGVELAYGHSAWVSLGPAAAFFAFTYIVIAVGASAVGLARTQRKARQAGVSLDYLGGLQKDERRKFEKQHGI